MTPETTREHEEYSKLVPESFEKLQALPPGQYWCMSKFDDSHEELDLFLVKVHEPLSQFNGVPSPHRELTFRKYTDTHELPLHKGQIVWDVHLHKLITSHPNGALCIAHQAFIKHLTGATRDQVAMAYDA
ncbi:MAG: hypothetical protein ABII07_05980 [Patescibacteria group bacterium]|nr:hypothetical protein [Patescibacteria group bacterium]